MQYFKSIEFIQLKQYDIKNGTNFYLFFLFVSNLRHKKTSNLDLLGPFLTVLLEASEICLEREDRLNLYGLSEPIEPSLVRCVPSSPEHDSEPNFTEERSGRDGALRWSSSLKLLAWRLVCLFLSGKGTILSISSISSMVLASMVSSSKYSLNMLLLLWSRYAAIISPLERGFEFSALFTEFK